MKIFLAQRGAGKTYQLVQLVKSDPAGVLVVRSHDQVRYVRESYGNDFKVISVNAVMALRGKLPIPRLYVDDFDFTHETLGKLRGFEIVAVSITGENEIQVLEWPEDLGTRLRAPKDVMLEDFETFYRHAGTGKVWAIGRHQGIDYERALDAADVG